MWKETMQEVPMKTFLSIFFIVAVVFTLGGCSNGSTEEAAANSVKTAQPDRPAPAAIETPVESPKTPSAPAVFEVPAGTSIRVTLIDGLSSKKNKSGDKFLATLAEPVVVEGTTVLEKGTKVQGRVLDAEQSGRVKGRAKISLTLMNVMDGEKQHPISTKPFRAEAESTKGRDAGIIGGAAGVGAAIGAIAGGGKGAAEGALIGGAAGTGGVLVTRGKEVEYRPETRLKFTLDKSVSLPKIAPKSS